MKPNIALVALFIAAFGGSAAEPQPEPRRILPERALARLEDVDALNSGLA